MKAAMCSFRRSVPLLALSIFAPVALTGAEALLLGQRQFASQTAAPLTDGKDTKSTSNP
jgi:hypothetical protein